MDPARCPVAFVIFIFNVINGEKDKRKRDCRSQTDVKAKFKNAGVD